MTSSHSARQLEINERAWRDHKNWIGPRWFACYRSSADSRLWVRKPPPRMAWTLNLGHDGARWWLAGIAAVTFALVVSAVLLR